MPTNRSLSMFFPLSLDYLLLNATYHSLQEPTTRCGVLPQDQRSQSSQATRDGIHDGHLPWIRPNISWTPHLPDPGQQAMFTMVCVYEQAFHLNDLGRPLLPFFYFTFQGSETVSNTGLHIRRRYREVSCVTSSSFASGFHISMKGTSLDYTTLLDHHRPMETTNLDPFVTATHHTWRLQEITLSIPFAHDVFDFFERAICPPMPQQLLGITIPYDTHEQAVKGTHHTL